MTIGSLVEWDGIKHIGDPPRYGVVVKYPLGHCVSVYWMDKQKAEVVGLRVLKQLT